jgi:hypothetical protein
MLDAVKKIPKKAKITARGSAPPAKGDPKGMEAAIAAPGAIEQIDWKTTSRKPTAFFSSCATYLSFSLCVASSSARNSFEFLDISRQIKRHWGALGK